MAERFEVIIRNKDSLSWIELKEIMEIIDDHIKESIRDHFRADPFVGRPGRRGIRQFRVTYEDFDSINQASFIEIERAQSGSIVLVILGAAATFALGAVAVGVRRSKLATELVRLGEVVGNALGEGLSEINQRLEEWSDANRVLRKRDTSVRIRRLPEESQDMEGLEEEAIADSPAEEMAPEIEIEDNNETA